MNFDECFAALLGGEIVRNDRIGRRRPARFANPDSDPRNCKLDDVLR